MSHETKGPVVSTSDSEGASQDFQRQSRFRTLRLVDIIRVGLTALALLCGLTVLGTSGDALAAYNTTSLPSDYFLPLWPDEFDLRPTLALVAGSIVVVVLNILSLVFSKTPMVSLRMFLFHATKTNTHGDEQLRGRTVIHTPLRFAAPFLGFSGALIAMIFFYAINMSTTVDTLQSWTCHWESVGMTVKPHFGTLCRESKTALYLSVILVPLEAIILSLASYQFILERKVDTAGPRSIKYGSPAPSS
jgi:hypothetical protein